MPTRTQRRTNLAPGWMGRTVQLASLFITCLALWPSAAVADDFLALDEALPGPAVVDVAAIAPVFTFADDGCFPAAPISRTGQKNGGEDENKRELHKCRSSNFMETSNTMHRYHCTEVDGDSFCFHVFALYFEMDVAGPSGGLGHRHEWERTIIWTKNGKITHASVSRHKEIDTLPYDALPLVKDNPNDSDGTGHVMVHYTDHNAGTAYFKFGWGIGLAADPEGYLSNYQGVTPPIASWYEFEGDGVSNYQMRRSMNSYSFYGGYGDTNCGVCDDAFLSKINNNLPAGYPHFPDTPLTKPEVRVSAQGVESIPEAPVIPPGTLLNFQYAPYWGTPYVWSWVFWDYFQLGDLFLERNLGIQVETGTTIVFDVSSARYAEYHDGIGFSTEPSGESTPINLVWDFDGATVSDPFPAFPESVAVTFDLPPGETDWRYYVSVTSYDTRGEPGTFEINVRVTGEGDLAVHADGQNVTSALVVRSGTTVQFEAIEQSQVDMCTWNHIPDASELEYPDDGPYNDDVVVLESAQNFVMDYYWSLDGDCPSCQLPRPRFNQGRSSSIYADQECSDDEFTTWYDDFLSKLVFCEGGACDASVPITFELAPDDGPRTVDVVLFVADYLSPTEVSVQVHITDEPTACVGPDADADGIPDCRDNCIYVPNGPALATDFCDSQEDWDGDGYGNPCDLDFNGDGGVGFDDVNAIMSAHWAGVSTQTNLDISCDGAVGLDDVNEVLSRRGEVPGPSAYHP